MIAGPLSIWPHEEKKGPGHTVHLPEEAIPSPSPRDFCCLLFTSISQRRRKIPTRPCRCFSWYIFFSRPHLRFWRCVCVFVRFRRQTVRPPTVVIGIPRSRALLLSFGRLHKTIFRIKFGRRPSASALLGRRRQIKMTDDLSPLLGLSDGYRLIIIVEAHKLRSNSVFLPFNHSELSFSIAIWNPRRWCSSCSPRICRSVNMLINDDPFVLDIRPVIF